VRLNVDVLCPEEILGAFYGKTFHNINILTPTIVPLAGITLSVLIGHETALGLQDCLANNVLGSDELQVGLQSFGLVVDRPKNFRIDLLQASGNQSYTLVFERIQAFIGP